jgi:hypothetical protein
MKKMRFCIFVIKKKSYFVLEKKGIFLPLSFSLHFISISFKLYNYICFQKFYVDGYACQISQVVY